MTAGLGWDLKGPGLSHSPAEDFPCSLRQVPYLFHAVVSSCDMGTTNFLFPTASVFYNYATRDLFQVKTCIVCLDKTQYNWASNLVGITGIQLKQEQIFIPKNKECKKM